MNPIRLNAAPPIAQRPRCPQCSTPLRPYWRTVKTARVPRAGGGYEMQDTEQWRGEYRGYGAFCRLSCCEKYANWHYNERQRKKEIAR